MYLFFKFQVNWNAFSKALVAFTATFFVLLGASLQNPIFRVTSRAGGHPTTVTLFKSIIGGISISQDSRETTYSTQPIETEISRITWVDPYSLSAFQTDLKQENFQNLPFLHPLSFWGGCGCDYLLITGWQSGKPHLIKRDSGAGDVEPLLQKFYETCGVNYRYHSSV